MNAPPTSVLERLKKYRFELTHLTILFIVLIVFHVVATLAHKASLERVLVWTQEWYQQDAAERLANLTATSLELLLESLPEKKDYSEREARKIVQDLNIIFSQQSLHQNVQAVCVLISRGSEIYAIDDGRTLFSQLQGDEPPVAATQGLHEDAINRYRVLQARLRREEQTQTLLEGGETFHIFVPFVPRGEYAGALYLRTSPDLSFMTREMMSNYDETALTFSSFILFGLLAMFYVSSYTLRQRNEAQAALFEEQKQRLADDIHHQKEAGFTKRIYHTHHKAEKVMGFVKEDLRLICTDNMEEIKGRVNKYASFVARAIYDMKWYDPPIQTIRGPLFETDVNEVLRFLVDHVLRRQSADEDAVRFELQLDPRVPRIRISEYVLWEVFEPILQNCLDHGGGDRLLVTIRSVHEPSNGTTTISVSDNGRGLPPELLEIDERGRKQIFLEHVTRAPSGTHHSGYGCHIAYQIATDRCGWTMDAENLPGGGCRFTFTMSHGA